MTVTNSNPRCQGQTKSGKPCRAAATSGGLCFFHANPNKAAELGRIGGRSKGVHAAGEDADPPAPLETATAVRDTVSRLIAAVYSGKLRPSVAGALAPLLNLQLRTIEKTDIEVRIAALERQLAEMEDKSLRKGPSAESA